MKTKNLMFSACMVLGLVLALTLALSLAAATVNVRYTVYSAVVEDDGNLTPSTTPVNDLDVVGYTCANAACTTIGSAVAGLAASTATNQITVVFPTALATNGYVLYFYKDGYIGWEQSGIRIWGDFPGQTFDAPNPVYLSRKATGYAPIMDLNVINQVQPNMPIQVGLNVSIDADTYAAIENAANSNIPLAETVETAVTLEIRDEDGAVLYTDTETVNVPYSGIAPVAFTYPGFSETENFIVQVSTEVTDNKIINSITQEAEAEIEVIAQNETDYAYTLINGLVMTPVMPDAGESVAFSFNYLSNYVDEDGDLNARDTIATITFYHDGVQQYSNEYELPSNQSSYTFARAFNEAGSYRIVVDGEPENAENYDDVVKATQEITFVVGEADEEEPEHEHHHYDSDDEEESEEAGLPLVMTSAGSTGKAIDLTKEKRLGLVAKILLALISAILILIIAIIIAYFYKK